MFPTATDDLLNATYKAILQELTEGVIVTDALGTIVFVNDAAAKIHGVVRLDVRPSAYAASYSLFREDGRPHPSLELPLARAVRGETVKDARWLIRRPDGEMVLAVGSARPLLDAGGRRLGALLILRDESAQHLAERSQGKREIALREAVGVLAKLVGAGAADGTAASAHG